MTEASRATLDYHALNDSFRFATFIDVFLAKKEIRETCALYFEENPDEARHVVKNVDNSRFNRLMYNLGLMTEFERQKYKAAREALDELNLGY